jgi:hypothetical protein
MNNDKLMAIVLVAVSILLGVLAYVVDWDGEPMSQGDFDVLCASRGGVPADDVCLKGTQIILAK